MKTINIIRLIRKKNSAGSVDENHQYNSSNYEKNSAGSVGVDQIK